MKAQKTEKGQALVLIILAIVGLFGFAALAVDLGQLYAERRRAQSAADAAALAAAYEAENGTSDPLWVAEDLAFENGGFENNMADTWVEVYNPPIDGPYEQCDVCNNNFDSTEYYQVKITRMLDPIFMQFLGRDWSMVTVEAVAHARPIMSISPGNAVHALSTDGDALTIEGNVDSLIIGGNLRSNGGGIKRGGSGEITVEDAKIYTATGWVNTRGVSPTPKHDGPVFVATPPEPNCNLPIQNPGNHETVLHPGLYPNGIDINAHDTVTMEPGMYCVENGIQIRGNGTVVGDQIFIVMLSGVIRNNGSSAVKWKRPNDLVDGSGNQWGGMLIYAPLPNTSEMHITGNNGTSYQGTIFNPGGKCRVGGTSLTIGMNAQIICNYVDMHGNPDMTITYVDRQNFRNPPMVELVQ